MPPISFAVVLAAGRGGRLAEHTDALPKPMVPVAGRPMVHYTLAALAAAGVEEAVVVTGYREAQVRAALARWPNPRLTFVSNPEFESGASLSLAAAEEACAGRDFLLVMADHLLSPELLRRLAASGPAAECRVAADRSRFAPSYAAEATLLKTDGARVLYIGKGLGAWDAVDAGAFACTPAAWEALAASPRGCDLSTLFGNLARAGRLYAADVTGAGWYDVDTPEDLAHAESLVADGLPHVAGFAGMAGIAGIAGAADIGAALAGRGAADGPPGPALAGCSAAGAAGP